MAAQKNPFLDLDVSKFMDASKMLADFFFTLTPVCFTSLGKLGRAKLTRFWTKTCAMSRLVPTSNVTVKL